MCKSTAHSIRLHYPDLYRAGSGYAGCTTNGPPYIFDGILSFPRGCKGARERRFGALL